MSEGTPSRASGEDAAASASRPSYSADANLVFTTAGAIALTRTLGANSCASCWVRLISAALLTPYAAMKGEGAGPGTEAMWRIAPPVAFCQAGQVFCAKPSAEITLVSQTLRATFRSR